MKPVSLFAFDDEVARCKIWRIWFISSRLRDYIDKQVPCSRLRDLGKSTCDRLWDFFCFFARGEAHSGDCTRRRRGKPAYVRSSQRGLRARCIYDQLRRRGGLSRRNTRYGLGVGTASISFLSALCKIAAMTGTFFVLRLTNPARG